jgi:energy-coupling factor transporter ATP-binding protein EcfA2
MKITEIKFSNYKAFYGDENSNTITINNGSNLLIYGENGSGKSSIYEGLRNLFLASNSVSDDAKFSRHLAVDEFITKGEGEDSKTVQVPAYIKLKLDDFNGNSKEIIYGTGGNVEGDSDIFEASKSCSFLSYKELLKTYLFNGESDPYKFQVNLAELIIKDILAQSINLSTTKTYIQNYNELWVAGKGTRPSRAQKEEIIREFDIGFTKDIEDINLVLNDLLYYFYPDLKIELYVIESYIDYETQNYPVFQVGLNCLHFGMDTNKNDETHLTILNESRLSALAICIFLSGIVIKTKKSTKIKFLFFDDIFIGLDTSNRIPLLKILTDFKSIVWKEDINVQTGHIVNQIQKKTKTIL